jgi:hypothetical protein
MRRVTPTKLYRRAVSVHVFPKKAAQTEVVIHINKSSRILTI